MLSVLSLIIRNYKKGILWFNLQCVISIFYRFTITLEWSLAQYWTVPNSLHIRWSDFVLSLCVWTFEWGMRGLISRDTSWQRTSWYSRSLSADSLIRWMNVQLGHSGFVSFERFPEIESKKQQTGDRLKPEAIIVMWVKIYEENLNF